MSAGSGWIPYYKHKTKKTGDLLFSALVFIALQNALRNLPRPSKPLDWNIDQQYAHKYVHVSILEPIAGVPCLTTQHKCQEREHSNTKPWWAMISKFWTSVFLYLPNIPPRGSSELCVDKKSLRIEIPMLIPARLHHHVTVVREFLDSSLLA